MVRFAACMSLIVDHFRQGRCAEIVSMSDTQCELAAVQAFWLRRLRWAKW